MVIFKCNYVMWFGIKNAFVNKIYICTIVEMHETLNDYSQHACIFIQICLIISISII